MFHIEPVVSFLFFFCSQGSPFESKSAAYSSGSAKHSSPESAASAISSEEHQEEEQPGTPVPSEDIEASDIGIIFRTNPHLLFRFSFLNHFILDRVIRRLIPFINVLSLFQQKRITPCRNRGKKKA